VEDHNDSEHGIFFRTTAQTHIPTGKRTCSHLSDQTSLLTADTQRNYLIRNTWLCSVLLAVDRPFPFIKGYSIGISGYIDISLYCQLQLDCYSNVAT